MAVVKIKKKQMTYKVFHKNKILEGTQHKKTKKEINK